MYPLGFLINQCQIITFLILKSDNIENSRIELKGIVLPIPSNQIKVTFIIFTLQLGTFVIFSCFTYKWKENVSGLLGGGGAGGAKGMQAQPRKLLGGDPPLPPLPFAPPPPTSQIIGGTPPAPLLLTPMTIYNAVIVSFWLQN